MHIFRGVPRALATGGLAVALLAGGLIWVPAARSDDEARSKKREADPEKVIDLNARALLEQGRRTFRYDTFGDEAFWGDKLRLHEALAGSKLGGVGSGVSPATALGVGLKVDVDALPNALKHDLAAGRVPLDDPATTLALLRLNAVVGVTGFFRSSGQLRSVGIQCSLCHSTVDDSFAPGIGRRLDGWPNRDLNVGAIVALSPDLTSVTSLLGVDDPTVRTVLNSWGPGRFDAQLFLDGKAFRPDGKSGSVLIPPAYGLAGVNMGTSTGFGSTTYWNAFVANLEMHGTGTFTDSRLQDLRDFPVAVRAGLDNVRADVNTNGVSDQITSKLAALHFYQLAIPAPRPPGPDAPSDVAVNRGERLFNGKAKCATCHVPPLFTEPGYNMHAPQDIGIDDFQSSRSPTKMYRTAPLAGLTTHEKGGYYHDGRFATLDALVQHYDRHLRTNLSPGEVQDLITYLRSL